MVNYIEAAAAPMKNTGAIRLYGPDAFEGMRRACQLTARCLDALWPMIKPGVTTNEIDEFVLDFGLAHGALLHLDQSRRLPRHPRRQAAA
jgi:methionyl aminopeptidase